VRPIRHRDSLSQRQVETPAAAADQGATAQGAGQVEVGNGQLGEGMPAEVVASSRGIQPKVLAISSQAGRRALAGSGTAVTPNGGRGAVSHWRYTMEGLHTRDRPRSALEGLDRQVRIARAASTAQAKLAGDLVAHGASGARPQARRR